MLDQKALRFRYCFIFLLLSFELNIEDLPVQVAYPVTVCFMSLSRASYLVETM